MKRVGIWFLLCCKRYLKKWSFLMILLALPAAAYVLHQTEKEEGQEIRIALYAEKGDGGREEEALEQQLAGNLAEKGKDGGLFRFYLCGSEEEVKNQVASRQAECGYVVSENLREKLDEKDYRRCIRVYSAPSTVLAELSTEVVFAALMELYDREIFLDYILESETVNERVSGLAQLTGRGGNQDDLSSLLKNQAGMLYDKWANNGSTFRFEYGYLEGKDGLKGEDPQANIFPVRGIVAVYLFLTGIYSTVMLGYDERKGLFAPLSPGKRGLCSMAALLAPVFLAALSGLGALKLGGCFLEAGREVTVMGAYLLAVCVFSWLMKQIFRKPEVLAVMIPFLLVGSLVFTPVLVDIRRFFPSVGWVEKLFLPSYYLRAF